MSITELGRNHGNHNCIAFSEWEWQETWNSLLLSLREEPTVPDDANAALLGKSFTCLHPSLDESVVIRLIGDQLGDFGVLDSFDNERERPCFRIIWVARDAGEVDVNGDEAQRWE